jgi:hypothetical protein
VTWHLTPQKHPAIPQRMLMCFSLGWSHGGVKRRTSTHTHAHTHMERRTATRTGKGNQVHARPHTTRNQDPPQWPQPQPNTQTKNESTTPVELLRGTYPVLVELTLPAVVVLHCHVTVVRVLQHAIDECDLIRLWGWGLLGELEAEHGGSNQTERNSEALPSAHPRRIALLNDATQHQETGQRAARTRTAWKTTQQVPE